MKLLLTLNFKLSCVVKVPASILGSVNSGTRISYWAHSIELYRLSQTNRKERVTVKLLASFRTGTISVTFQSKSNHHWCNYLRLQSENWEPFAKMPLLQFFIENKVSRQSLLAYSDFFRTLISLSLPLILLKPKRNINIYDTTRIRIRARHQDLYI